jgi:hypothetical protein
VIGIQFIDRNIIMVNRPPFLALLRLMSIVLNDTCPIIYLRNILANQTPPLLPTHDLSVPAYNTGCDASQLSCHVPSLAYFSILNMEAIYSFGTLVNIYQTIWHHIPEDLTHYFIFAPQYQTHSIVLMIKHGWMKTHGHPRELIFYTLSKNGKQECLTLSHETYKNKSVRKQVFYTRNRYL